MELKIDVKGDIAKDLAPVWQLDPDNFPYIASLAINRTARNILNEENKQSSSVFDRPTSSTKRASFMKVATKDRLEAEVRLKDDRGKGGIAPEKYLQAEVYGGERKNKRYEVVLERAGILPSGMQTVPAKGFPLDQYGNLPASYVVAMLSGLKAFQEVGFTANRRGKGRGKYADTKFFYVNHTMNNHSTLPMGIYERVGQGQRGVLMFVRKARYQTRLPYFDIADRVIRATFNVELKAAIEYAMAKAKHGRISAGDIASLFTRGME